MFFSGLVVEQHLALEHVFEQSSSNHAKAAGLRRRALYDGLERVVRGAGVAVGECGHALDERVGHLDAFSAVAALGVRQRAAQQDDQLLRRERLEHVHLRARKQRRDHLE